MLAAFHASRRVPRLGNSPRQNSAYLSTEGFVLVLRAAYVVVTRRFE
jgi:hypothetical protein